jgi:hypothetical protein
MREIKNFDIKKACGDSPFHNKILKQCPAIVNILYLLYCKMIEKCQIPDKLKIGCVTPVLKTGRPKI